MMNREMMEEIFENYCCEHDMAWYEVFDGERMEEVNRMIRERAGWSEDDMENNDEWCNWMGDMAMDL